MRTRLMGVLATYLSIVEGLRFSLISGAIDYANFDLSPLYRSAIGFDRLFNH